MSAPQMIPVVAQRTSDQVVLYLHQKQAPPVLPFELHGHVSPDSWASRIPTLIRLTSRYNKPLFEGIWMLVYFITAIAVPAALYPVIFHALDKNATNTFNNFNTFDNFNNRINNNDRPFFETRFITFGIFVGITLFFWIPILVWKHIGQTRATALVNKWAAEDSRNRGAGTFVPVWKVTLPGSFTNNTRLIVTLPPSQIPSSFHPALYQQSWINGPVDGGSGYPGQGFQGGYNFQDGSGYNNPNMYGNIPLYSNDKAPAYNDDGNTRFTDEKQRFDDVKV
ncbi:hypothetical protein BV25DRAFT_1891819 [Artomyces pyxidatus]|uniref:Uncharacterized protein n=1 Tax=Artomyces pyxidatus TaxID=48021 RepID=A0ACB8SNM6_9AGAM|nr:hypothetical protein BV25DRAFT_1891819 [Artomyces pyxidatus]